MRSNLTFLLLFQQKTNYLLTYQQNSLQSTATNLSLRSLLLCLQASHSSSQDETVEKWKHPWPGPKDAESGLHFSKKERNFGKVLEQYVFFLKMIKKKQLILDIYTSHSYHITYFSTVYPSISMQSLKGLKLNDKCDNFLLKHKTVPSKDPLLWLFLYFLLIFLPSASSLMLSNQMWNSSLPLVLSLLSSS